MAFESNLSVGSPIQIQTTLVPGTQISQVQPLVIKWTGGDPGTLVKVSLISVQAGGIYSLYAYGYKDAASGSFTFTPRCSGSPPGAGGSGVICTFGIPPSYTATVVVEVAPTPSKVTQVGAQGITGTVQISWVYRYVFAGLHLG